MNTFKSPFILLLASIFVFSFSSCSDDDGPSQSASNNTSSGTLIGAWEMTSLNYAGETSTSAGGVTITSEFSGVGKDFTYVMEFNDNPKTYSTSGGYVVDLTTTVSGTSFTQEVPIVDYVTSGTWSVSNNELTTTDDNTGESSTTKILSSSNSNFSLDFAGFFGDITAGADATITDGQADFKKK